MKKVFVLWDVLFLIFIVYALCTTVWGQSEPKTDVYAIANEVIAGKWGNGLERKEALTHAGYNPKEVQTLVNNILSGKVKNRATSKLQSRGIGSEKDLIHGYIHAVSNRYRVDPTLIESVVWYESEYNPRATTGSHVGLMQVSTRWHKDRAKKLGVTNLYDPYGNILVGVDYLSDLLEIYEDPALALMIYNMGNNAKRLYADGKISAYAKNVLAMSAELKREVGR
jgi:soluble lytic murein transglycosylase-like protein